MAFRRHIFRKALPARLQSERILRPRLEGVRLEWNIFGWFLEDFELILVFLHTFRGFFLKIFKNAYRNVPFMPDTFYLLTPRGTRLLGFCDIVFFVSRAVTFSFAKHIVWIFSSTVLKFKIPVEDCLVIDIFRQVHKSGI